MIKRTISRAEAEVSAGGRARGQTLPQRAELDVALATIDSLQVHCAELQGQVTEMRRGQAALEQSRNQYQDLYEFAPVGYLTVSVRAVTHINVAATRLLGVEREHILGHRFSQFIVDRDRARFSRLLRQVRKYGDRRRLDLELRRWDETTFHAQLDCMTVPNGREPTVRITVIDITERKRAEAEIRRLAFYDPLTGLPNRRLLLERLGLAVSVCARKGHSGAVLFLDLDEFKALNDLRGHAVGDLLLEHVGRRLLGSVRVGDTVSRLGGDEFVVVLEGLNKDPAVAVSETRRVAEKILAALNENYMLAGTRYYGTASMGFTAFHDDGVTVQGLLAQADTALYRAKAMGRGTVCCFDREMREEVLTRGALLADLRRAVEEEQFVLHYQPQVDQKGEWTGAEALLRWEHPTRGLLSPDAFLTLAEERGLMEPIGQWVFEAACATLKSWSGSARLAHLTLALNVSAYEFRHPQYAERVEAALDRTGVDPRRLMLEFTEGLLFSTMEETRAKMQGLRARGVRFAVDDFGIGYSSLTYLQSLPLDQLKIDQSFVRNLPGSANDAIIVRSILALGQNLGLEVVAEGVEREEQLEALRSYGCAGYQGFLFGRPVVMEELATMAGRGAGVGERNGAAMRVV